MAFSLRFNPEKINQIADKIIISEPLNDEFLAFIGEELVNISSEAFDSEMSPMGERWADWSTNYAKRPFEKGGPKIGKLRRNLDLYRSVDYEISGRKLYIGSNMRYAAAHQFGYEKSGIPQRAYIGFTPDFEDRILADPVVQEMLQR